MYTHAHIHTHTYTHTHTHTTLKGKCYSLCGVQLFVTPWTVAHQAPLSMGFSRQENAWVAVSFCRESSQLRDGTQVSCVAGRFFTESPGKPYVCVYVYVCVCVCICVRMYNWITTVYLMITPYCKSPLFWFVKNDQLKKKKKKKDQLMSGLPLVTHVPLVLPNRVQAPPITLHVVGQS